MKALLALCRAILVSSTPLAVPVGARAEKERDGLESPRPVSVGGRERLAFPSGPSSALVFAAHSSPGTRLVVWCGRLDPEAAAGTRLTCRVRIDELGANAAVEKILVLHPGPGRRQAGWRRLVVPVPAGAEGSEIRITLSIDPIGSCAGHESEEAAWGDPVLERRRPLIKLLASAVAAVRLLGVAGTARRLRSLTLREKNEGDYRRWVRLHTPDAAALMRMQEEALALCYRPRISIVVPVSNTNPVWLRACIESVKRQIYTEWELCICDDGSVSSRTLGVLHEYERDERIRVAYLPSPLNISRASNAALALATGEFVALLDHDDELPPEALYEVARFLNRLPSADVIYSDEDKLDLAGARRDPHFKPGWSPDYLRSCMYTGHLLVVRRRLIDELGGFRTGYEGSQDHDLMLRIMERTDRIHHLPKVLYHWRQAPLSASSSHIAKPWAVEAGRRAVADHLERLGVDAEVLPGAAAGHSRVRHAVLGNPLVSIVMTSDAPGREGSARVAASIRSILNRTSYRRYELLVAVEGVEEGPFEEGLAELVRRRNARVAAVGAGLCTAERLNRAAQNATGDYLVTVAGGIRVVSRDWLSALLEYGQQEVVGAAGAKLYSSDGRLAHVGLVLGGPNVVSSPFAGCPAWHPGYVHSAFGVRDYSAVAGIGMMTRRQVFEEIGPFETRLGSFLWDVDYCLRLRRSGRRVVFTPYARLRLTSDAGSRDAAGGFAAEAATLSQLWGEALHRDPYYNPNFDRAFADYRLPAFLRGDVTTDAAAPLASGAGKAGRESCPSGDSR
jgi:O-antigen biosynthesis protein